MLTRSGQDAHVGGERTQIGRRTQEFHALIGEAFVPCSTIFVSASPRFTAETRRFTGVSRWPRLTKPVERIDGSDARARVSTPVPCRFRDEAHRSRSLIVYSPNGKCRAWARMLRP